MNHIGVVIAVKSEAEALLADSSWDWKKDERNIYRSKKYPVTIIICGIGKAFAVSSLMTIAPECDTFLSLGTSGGLSDQKIGDIYIAHEFVEHDLDLSGLGFKKGVTPFSNMDSAIIIPVVDQHLKELSISFLKTNNISYTSGRSMSGDQFISNRNIVTAKRTLFKCDICDMESAALAKISCFRLLKPFFAIRYISDNADHNAQTDWNGEVKKSSIIFNALLKFVVQ